MEYEGEMKVKTDCSIPFASTPSAGDLIISSDNEFNKLHENYWSSITVNANLCNSMNGDLDISNNPNLQSIVIKMNSFTNVRSLTISNNINLVSIRFEGGSCWDGAFLFIHTFTLSSFLSFS